MSYEERSQVIICFLKAGPEGGPVKEFIGPVHYDWYVL